MRVPAAAAALAIGLAPAGAAAQDELRYDPWPHAAITTGVGLLLAGDLAARHSLAPEDCTHCGGNAFDRSLTEALAWENHGLATTFSDVGLVLLPASAVIYGFAEDGWEGGAIDALVFAETFAINFVATEALKFAVARERPLHFYLDAEHEKVSEREEDWFVSFPSGHASSGFVSVAAMATIADLRGRDPTAIWLVGLPVAASVAYFRVAGYHHWTTDVLSGAALGTIIGIAVPRLLHGPGGLGKEREQESDLERQPLQIFQLGGSF